MKAYTDLSQSKKLAEILPLDSADMSYTLDFDSGMYRISTTSYKGWIVPKCAESYKGLAQVVPCWSLAALLDVLESEIDGENGETYKLNIEKDGTWWDVWYCEEYVKQEAEYILKDININPNKYIFYANLYK